ncbi:MAG TPA: papain-like cysteine protease family protein [Myxococcota bacterium]
MSARYAAVMKARALLLAATMACASAGARAEERCGTSGCVAGVRADDLVDVYAQQQQTQWCWVASIAMLFRYYHHDVAQKRIVADTYGSAVNLPAGNGAMLTNQINREWIDESGGRFRATATTYDTTAHVRTLDAATIVDELKNDHPLIWGAQGHAMLLTGVAFVRSDNGDVVITGGVVRDPWPGRGKRNLTQQELVPQYIAKVVVEDLVAKDAPACRSSCQSAHDTCAAAVPAPSTCMAAAVASCMTLCADEASCRKQCDPEARDNKAAWAPACAQESSTATARCDDDRARCFTACP